MKRGVLIKISVIATIVLISTFSLAFLSRADDDQSENDDNNTERNRSVLQTPPVQEQLPTDLPVTILPPVIEAPIDSPIIEPELYSGDQSEQQAKPVSVSVPKPIVTTNAALITALRDTDKDGIPDAVDKHPGLDDYSFHFIDENNDGIADDLEALIN